MFFESLLQNILETSTGLAFAKDEPKPFQQPEVLPVGLEAIALGAILLEAFLRIGKRVNRWKHLTGWVKPRPILQKAAQFVTVN